MVQYNVITRKNYFAHNKDIVIQYNSLAMGAPSSGLIAEIFLQHIEHTHLATGSANSLRNCSLCALHYLPCPIYLQTTDLHLHNPQIPHLKNRRQNTEDHLDWHPSTPRFRLSTRTRATTKKNPPQLKLHTHWKHCSVVTLISLQKQIFDVKQLT